jgi:hypothetical protein
VAAQVVFARGEKGGWSFVCGAIVERCLPDITGRATERLHTATLLKAYSSGDGCGEERGIHRFAREGGSWKWQRSLGSALRRGKSNVIYGNGTMGCHVDAERVQVLKSLTAYKLSAHLMARCGFAFNQRYTSSLAGERDGGGTACHSTTNDENFVLQSIAPGSLDLPSIHREILYFLSNLIDVEENSLKGHSV